MTNNEAHAIDEALFENHIENHLEPYLSTKQLAEKINVKPDTVLHWVCRYRDFPVEKLGRVNRFRLSEVIAYFRQKKKGRTWQSRN